jgi:hypothetical protein
MEYVREARINIFKDTNKSSFDENLTLGEFSEDETIEEFIIRINKRMKEVYLDEYE